MEHASVVKYPWVSLRRYVVQIVIHSGIPQMGDRVVSDHSNGFMKVGIDWLLTQLDDHLEVDPMYLLHFFPRARSSTHHWKNVSLEI